VYCAYYGKRKTGGSPRTAKKGALTYELYRIHDNLMVEGSRFSDPDVKKTLNPHERGKWQRARGKDCKKKN